MKKALLIAAATMFAATGANATVIDFESYSDPTNSASLLDSGATFTALGSTTGFEVSAYSQANWGTAAPQILCPRTAANYCGGDFQISFAAAVTGLNFLFTGDDSTSALTVEAFLGATSLGIQNFSPDGASLTSHLVDLSGLGLIDRIVLTNASNDPAGFGYDDITFNDAAVPEPATWAMMLMGFGAAGLAMRRRRRHLLAQV